MQKQIKKLKKKYQKSSRKTKQFARFLRIRKNFKYQTSLLNATFKKICQKSSLKDFSKIINIKIKANNIFCTLKNLDKKLTVYNMSAGKCKIKTSKKLLRYSIKQIVNFFFAKIRRIILNTKSILVNITGPKRIRKVVIKLFETNLKRRHLIININQKKCFNGCRAKKQKRKKQKKFRILKY